MCQVAGKVVEPEQRALQPRVGILHFARLPTGATKNSYTGSELDLLKKRGVRLLMWGMAYWERS